MKDGNIEVCKCNFIHEDAVNGMSEKIISTDMSIQLAEFYKAFSDATRIKILSALIYRELCVCDLAYLLGITQPAVSYQLKQLKFMNLVKYRKEGKIVYFSLADTHVEMIFKAAMDHIKVCSEF